MKHKADVPAVPTNDGMPAERVAVADDAGKINSSLLKRM